MIDRFSLSLSPSLPLFLSRGSLLMDLGVCARVHVTIIMFFFVIVIVIVMYANFINDSAYERGMHKH